MAAATLTEDDMKIRAGIFSVLGKQLNNPEFSDLIVVAGTSEFSCHRVFLSTVSDFFCGLLASGMKEVEEGRVTLKSISGEVFSYVLTCIYTGQSVVTETNLFDVWYAADLLGVAFLLQLCRDFFTRSLSVDNCFEFCVNVRLLSDTAKQEALDFIVSKFQRIRTSNRFADLTFPEMKYVVSSEELNTATEDDVAEVILRWVESTQTETSGEKSTKENALSEETEEMGGDQADGGKSGSEVGAGDAEPLKSNPMFEKDPDSPSEILAQLLECSRYLLMSQGFVVNTLMQHKLVKNDAKCHAIVMRILRYAAQSDFHQEWCPRAAIHRNTSSWKNVIIHLDSNYSSSLEVECLNIHTNDSHFPESVNVYLAGISRHTLSCGIFYRDEYLYTLSSRDKNILSFSTISRQCKNVSLNVQHDQPIGHAIFTGQALHVIQTNAETQETFVRKLRVQSIVHQDGSPANLELVCQLKVKTLKVKAVTSIGNKLIVFWGGNGATSYVVECYDLARCKSTLLEDQLGSPSNLVTFRKDTEAFVLQENGALWRIELCPSTEQLVFTQELQLWDGTFCLDGAVLFDSQIFISGQFTHTNREVPNVESVSLDGVFNKIIFHETCGSKVKRLVHAVLPKDKLPKN